MFSRWIEMVDSEFELEDTPNPLWEFTQIHERLKPT